MTRMEKKSKLLYSWWRKYLTRWVLIVDQFWIVKNLHTMVIKMVDSTSNTGNQYVKKLFLYLQKIAITDYLWVNHELKFFVAIIFFLKKTARGSTIIIKEWWLEGRIMNRLSTLWVIIIFYIHPIFVVDFDCDCFHFILPSSSLF